MPSLLDPESLLAEYKESMAEQVKKRRQRSKLTTRLTEEAQAAHKTGKYEISFDKFVNLLAVIELDPSEKVGESETHATIVANIASALHFLGDSDNAKEWYARALAEFEKTPTGWYTYLVTGDLNTKRMAYIHARLDILQKRERPDPSSYQDGTGKTRKWTKEEMEGTDRSWSILQPRTWWYGGYVPPGQQASSNGSDASGAYSSI